MKIDLLKDYLRLTQNELIDRLFEDLQKYYKDVTIFQNRHFIYARGNINIVLVAHLDTVFQTSRANMNIYYDKEQKTMWSPQGLGTDDRAGVFTIMSLLRDTRLRPHIIFTTNEETDLSGACYAAQFGLTPNFVIELDRQGRGESVFYDCDNKKFEEYINSFGFHTCIGSYTDISILCPAWKCAGVNLAVGYYYEHSYCEMWNYDDWEFTYDRLIKILKDYSESRKFEYIPVKKEKK